MEIVFDRPVYQEEHAAQLIMARRLHSPHKGRIHLRRSVDRPFAFPLQSVGGPYIAGTMKRQDSFRVADNPAIDTWARGRAKFTFVNKKVARTIACERCFPKCRLRVQPLRAATVYLSSQLAKQPSLGHLPIALSGFRRNS